MKRLLILGDSKSGKTTFMNILLNKQLPQHQQPTLGVQAGATTIQFSDKSFVNLQVWDTPGQEEYAEMAYPFYSNCKIFVLVMNRMKREGLESLEGWLKKIEDHNPGNPNTVLIILNKVPQVLFSGNNHQTFTKQSLQATYKKQLQDLKRKQFHITIMEIDLIQQREHLNKTYLHPYLRDMLTEEIIIEREEKRIGRLGAMDCRNDGCEVM